jgi:hypothetical protein
MAQTEYTTIAIVKSRIGNKHVDADVTDSEVTQWIQEGSNFIDLSTKRIGVGFETTDPLFPTVQQIVTDLAVIKLLLRISGAGLATTSGLSYKVGEFSVDKKNLDASSIKEIKVYEASAKESLATLKEYLQVEPNKNAFVGASVTKGETAPTTNYGDNSPQE